MNEHECKEVIIKLSPKVFSEVNDFALKTLQTRGGRIGSGMGLLLEALWGYYLNVELLDYPFELAWFPDHQYNDFACLYKDLEWKPESREGEALRIEVKSMNLGADESKAHFDILEKEVEEHDLLLVMVWKWEKISDKHFAPQIVNHYVDTAIPLIHLRDQLHLKRGGSFIEEGNCPDGCDIQVCSHIGEPLNAAGKRERLTGPVSTRPSQNVSYAANFGGLIRMLKTNSEEAFNKFKQMRKENVVADKYISFIHSQYPQEELSQYPKRYFDELAKMNNIDIRGMSKQDVYHQVRESDTEYMVKLKKLD